MNFTIFNCILFLVFLSIQGFAKIPQTWIMPNAASENLSLFSGMDQLEVSAGAQALHTDEDFNKLFNTGYQVIDSDSNTTKGNKPWYLQSMKGELGIESSGEIGWVGLSGEAAVELVWTRTAWSLKELQREHFGDIAAQELKEPLNHTLIQPLTQPEETSTVTLETHMPTSEVATQIDGIVHYIGSTKKVSNLSLLKTQLLKKVLAAQELAEKTEEISLGANWQPYKYQLELYVEAGGMVLPAFVVGGVMRLRFEWKIRPKIVNVSTSVSKLWDQLNPQFENLQFANSDSDDYVLVGVKIGVGFGMKGDIGIAEGKFSVMGNVFLRPTKVTQKTSTPIPCEHLVSPADDNIPYYFSDANLTRNRTVFSPISRLIFCKSIEKVDSMARYITKAATQYERKQDFEKKHRKFELGNIEIELQLSAAGRMFLPTVTKKTFYEIFYTKKNRL